MKKIALLLFYISTAIPALNGMDNTQCNLFSSSSSSKFSMGSANEVEIREVFKNKEGCVCLRVRYMDVDLDLEIPKAQTELVGEIKCVKCVDVTQTYVFMEIYLADSNKYCFYYRKVKPQANLIDLEKYYNSKTETLDLVSYRSNTGVMKNLHADVLKEFIKKHGVKTLILGLIFPNEYCKECIFQELFIDTQLKVIILGVIEGQKVESLFKMAKQTDSFYASEIIKEQSKKTLEMNKIQSLPGKVACSYISKQQIDTFFKSSQHPFSCAFRITNEESLGFKIWD